MPGFVEAHEHMLSLVIMRLDDQPVADSKQSER
jgi:predicted amidohydrolase YtcJ